MTEARRDGEASPPRLGRRLLPLQIGVALQAFMLWTPVEKLFLSEIGFTAATIGVMAAAYSVVVPLLEVPSGILADRWSRTGLLVLSSIALAGSVAVGGASNSVATYVAAAAILGVYFALNSGTVDSVVYDSVVEETGGSALYETWVGRVRMIEAASLAASSLVGGLLAEWTSARTTYWLSVPFACLSIVAFLLFREPQLHRTTEPSRLREHITTTVRALTTTPALRGVLLLSALTGVLQQAIFEFGPLWLVADDAPAAAYGPYWAALVGSLGVGGYLVGRVHLDRTWTLVTFAALLVAAPVVLGLTHALWAVIIVQTAIGVLVAVVGIHAGLLVHDAVPSNIRTGVASGVSTLSWIAFLPFSLGLGWLTRELGVSWAGWVLSIAGAALAVLLVASSRRKPPLAAEETEHPLDDELDVEAVPAGTYPPVPSDIACRDLVHLITEYLDGVLPADWRHGLTAHLTDCDGCSQYLRQIRAVIDALERSTANADTPSR